MYINLKVGEIIGKRTFGDLVIDRRIILKWILEMWFKGIE
jgi:hypothetical protein